MPNTPLKALKWLSANLKSDKSRILLAFSFVCGIIFFFPLSYSFPYEFQTGQKWQYDDLIAKMDFAVLKSQQIQQEDKAQVLKSLKHIYAWQENIQKQQLAQYNRAFKIALEDFKKDSLYPDLLKKPTQYHKEGYQILKALLDKPIVEQTNQDYINGDQIQFTKNNVSQDIVMDSLMSVEDAQEELIKRLEELQLKDADALLNIIDPLLISTMEQDLELEKFRHDEAIQELSTTAGMVKKDSIIVSYNQLINDEINLKLISYKKELTGTTDTTLENNKKLLGYFLITGLGFFLIGYMLRSYDIEVYNRFSKILFLFSFLTIFVGITSKLVEVSYIYIVPYCLVPIVLKHLHGDRVALVLYVIMLIIIDSISGLGYGFIIIQLFAGLVVFSKSFNVRIYWSLFKLLGAIFLVYLVSSIGMDLITGTFNFQVFASHLGIFLANVLFLVLSNPLIPFFEKTFGYTTSFALSELTELGHPLLKEMLLKAPGTFQHSMQVANLAEHAAIAIGADHLLVKVGALYHDIGKTENPQFFIENQREANPGLLLDPISNAQRIIAHIKDGLKLAKQHRLPDSVAQFIATHHGTTRVEYFYRDWVIQNRDVIASDDLFRYPGPRPSTKEHAILMMADSLEASARSLPNPTHESLHALVQRIVQGKIDAQQFALCPISFSEVEQCKKVFVEMLSSIHHLRIEYPIIKP